MTPFTIHLTHGRGSFDVQADDYAVRDGALWLLQETGPRSSATHMTPVLTLAANTWWAVAPADADPVAGIIETESPPPSSKPRRPLQILPEYNPDPDV